MFLKTVFYLGAFLSAENNTPEALVRSEDLKAHVYFLSGDEMQGREAGTESANLAARYLIDVLESYGIQPAALTGTRYLQGFEKNGLALNNVAGWIEGSDPKLKEEYVIIGAHYDHVGMGHQGSLAATTAIHNGADDNASGTASVLELAQVFSRFPTKRSILILFFTAEEKGLWGSEYYCENPLRPLEGAVAMLNLDMVGRSENRYLFIGGVGTGNGLEDLVETQAKGTGLRLETKSGGTAPSDNANFFKQEIPVLFFFTNVHEDYHAPGDDWWKLNYEEHANITRYVYRVAKVLAEEPKRRTFHQDGSMAVPKDFGERMGKLMGKMTKKKKGKEKDGEKK